MNSAQRKKALLEALNDVLIAYRQPPTNNYRRREIQFATWNVDDAGGEPVTGANYDLDAEDVEMLIEAVRTQP